MRPGTRVLITRSAWPERVLCTATVVRPPGDGTYPQPGPHEVLLLIDDDPVKRAPTMLFEGGEPTGRHWSCAHDVHGLSAL